MADEIIIETSTPEVIEVGVPGPQGPKGDKGDPGDVAGLPLTTTGDTLYRASSGQNARLPIGSSGQILKVAASGIPEWGAAPASGVTSVNGQTGAVTIRTYDGTGAGPGLVPQATGSDVGEFLRGDGTWTRELIFNGGSSGLVPSSFSADQANFLRADGAWGDAVTPSDVESDYYDRGTNDAATRPGTGGQKRYQIVLANDTRLTDNRRPATMFPPPSSPTDRNNETVGTLSYDGAYLYFLMNITNVGQRWLRVPVAAW